MPRTADINLAESLDEIRNATAMRTLSWKRMLHPITGEQLAFKGTFEEPGSEVFLIDDDWSDAESEDEEDGPSITRYPGDDDIAFDAIVLGKFAETSVREELAKLIRLVRKVAQ